METNQDKIDYVDKIYDSYDKSIFSESSNLENLKCPEAFNFFIEKIKPVKYTDLFKNNETETNQDY